MKENIQDLNIFYESFSEFLTTGGVGNISRFLDKDTSEISEKILLIYRNGYLKSCIDALKNSFGVTWKILGDDSFTKIAKEYVLEYPPRQGTLVGYGEQFPEYVLARCSMTYIGELAKLDQAWLNTLNSRCMIGLTAKRVAQLDEQEFDISQLGVALIESANVVELEFQVFEVWEIVKRAGDITSMHELSGGLNSVLFWQDDNIVNVRALLVEEAEFFRQIRLGRTLGESASYVTNIFPNADVAELFSNLLVNNLLIERKVDGIID